MAKCRYCEAEFNGNFCPFCGGAALQNNEQTPFTVAQPVPVPVNSTKKKGWIAPILISIAVILLLAGLLFSFFPKGSDHKTTVMGSVSTTTSSRPAASSQTQSVFSGERASVGYSLTGEKWKVSLLSAKLYDELKLSNLYTQTPEAGKKYLVVFMEVENITGQNDYFNYFYLNSYVDGYKNQMTYPLAQLDGYSILTGDVAAGKKLQGCYVWEVNENFQELEFTYQELGANDAYPFFVTREQVQ